MGGIGQMGEMSSRLHRAAAVEGKGRTGLAKGSGVCLIHFGGAGVLAGWFPLSLLGCLPLPCVSPAAIAVCTDADPLDVAHQLWLPANECLLLSTEGTEDAIHDFWGDNSAQYHWMKVPTNKLLLSSWPGVCIEEWSDEATHNSFCTSSSPTCVGDDSQVTAREQAASEELVDDGEGLLML